MDNSGRSGRTVDPLALALTAFFALLIVVVAGLMLLPNIF